MGSSSRPLNSARAIKESELIGIIRSVAFNLDKYLPQPVNWSHQARSELLKDKEAIAAASIFFNKLIDLYEKHVNQISQSAAPASFQDFTPGSPPSTLSRNQPMSTVNPNHEPLVNETIGQSAPETTTSMPRDNGPPQPDTPAAQADAVTPSVSERPPELQPYSQPRPQQPAASPPPTVTLMPSPVAAPQSPIRFSLVNAKVGQEYSGQLIAMGGESGKLKTRMMKIDKACHGLNYQDDNQQFQGTPTAAGEFDMHFQWSNDGKAWHSGKCILIVNPDPRSLWRVVELPKNALFYKEDADSKLIQTQSEHWRIAAASRRGRSHEHNGSFRDDDFFIDECSDTGWNILIVADGAGSAPYSRQGSHLAALNVGTHLRQRLGTEIGFVLNNHLAAWGNGTPEQDKVTIVHGYFQTLFREAASTALHEIERTAEKHQHVPKDYATTLLVAAVKKQGACTFVATFWIGDGAIAAWGPRGKVRMMGEPDSGEYAGQTRFLDRACLTAEHRFPERISIGYFPDIQAVLLMTDGVSDPRFETDSGLKQADKWDHLWDDLAPVLNDAETEKKLLEWLHFFTPGHHDDRTLALMWTD